ncbi:GATA zinc finger domain-containing protein [Echinococcus granulosus]|uniref:GATA zinc finger domain-containing protein n=1 Tax=Echinococcus granulosus TaxID=6210 RepID=U6J2S7_ECHGR|nr:GATA zinc finger domain-containing protein [Echinococcus granulosus]EUB63834.1 GATA zinc finger domain-containing protein [Echinococcus granulosus]CDS16005.1 GATA zinc finger domain containing protein [Echinococcus granulosus]
MSSDRAVAAFDGQASERACRRKRTVKTDSDFDFTGPMKKALRSRGVANKAKSSNGSSSSKFRSRRSIFKTSPTKLAPPRAFVRLESRILHKGKWLQIGDIVSVMDVDGGEYYAQVRSIIVDSFEDASVVLTWLVPTSEATRGEFDPTKYVIGMEEELPRSINCVSFLCHCPSDYFRPTDSPYTLQSWNPHIPSSTK